MDCFHGASNVMITVTRQAVAYFATKFARKLQKLDTKTMKKYLKTLGLSTVNHRFDNVAVANCSVYDRVS